MPDGSQEAIERSFEALLDLLTEHFMAHEYLLGDRPCLADFAMMGPLYAHLYRAIQLWYLQARAQSPLPVPAPARPPRPPGARASENPRRHPRGRNPRPRRPRPGRCA